MRLNITDINRINTCGYLNKNNWDYEKETSSNPSYLSGIKEALRWHYKRNKAVDQESFMAFIASSNLKNNLNINDKINLESAFRKFIESNFYRNIKNLFINHTSDFKISKSDYLENVISCFINDKDKPCFVYYNLGNESKEILLQRYDFMHNAIWSFYHLNKLPRYINIWFDGKEIRYEQFKVDEKYILKCKKIFIILGKNINNFVIPPVHICKSCSKISMCDRFYYNKIKKE